ncbi:hypothetical protein MNBD_DELTA01-2130 [hydrothermal vent metagenome]|uniref:Uncharacterized protein n=1 Tax=hydrothermal vent metagenome TaxID=652676 RepID=A0A3B0QU78_9ZZZZ
MKTARRLPAFLSAFMIFVGLVALASLVGCTAANNGVMQGRGPSSVGDTASARGGVPLKGRAVSGSRLYSPEKAEPARRYFIEIGVAGKDSSADQPHSGDISGGSIFDDTTRSRLKREVYLKPGNWTAHYHLGLFYMSRGEFELAEKSLHKAMEYKGSPLLVYNALGTLYESMGNQEKAVDLFKSALAVKKVSNATLAPVASIAIMNAANTYMRIGQLEKAEKYLRKADETELSQSAVFNYNMTLILYRTEQYGEALERIERTISAGREDYLIRYTKASVLVKLNRYNEALEIFGQLKAERPGDARLYKNMGVIYELYTGDMARALQNYVGYIGIVGEDSAGAVTLWADVVRARISRQGNATRGVNQ